MRPVFISVQQSLLVTVATAALSTTAVFLPAAKAQAQSIGAYLSSPQSQSTIYTGTTTETFESLGTGNRTTDFVSTIGTYALTTAAPFNIQADNQYGAGTGQYMTFGAQSSTSAPFTLTFNSAQSYFGLSVNAVDANNGLSFYNGSTLLGRFSSRTLTNLLANTTVKAVDNSDYNSADYYGKPGTGAVRSNRTNNGEAYAFVNFIASGLTFTSVVFDNSGVTGSGFETDNHTIRTAPVTPNGSFVLITQVTAPEPGSLALLLPVMGAVGMIVRRRK